MTTATRQWILLFLYKNKMTVNILLLLGDSHIYYYFSIILILTALTLNSGIFDTGSKAGFVTRLTL